MNRFYQGDWIDSMASRFVDELPDEYIRKNNNFINEKEDDFEFNQDIDFDSESEIRSPVGYDTKKIKMRLEINNFITSNNLDGYILPKNDNYFTEYSKVNNLQSISGFSGSSGFAIFLKNKKYLFVDGRYTFQAEKQSGKNFKICEIPYVLKDILKKYKDRI